MKESDIPKITLVTPSFNQVQFLEETLCSVLDQSYPKLEYIVMDGGSTDGSVEIIRKYEKHLAFWCSEKDKGQTDAIRRGFQRATGRIMNWLNSDDLLAPEALNHVAEMSRLHPEEAIFAAATENFIDGQFEVKRTKSIPSNLTIDGFLFRTKEPINRHQPGIFFTRDIYERVGGFRDNYHICMDADLHLRMVEVGAKVAYSDYTVAYFRQHAASKTQGGSVRNTLCAVREYMAICEEVGFRVGVRPNHRRGHLRTLLGISRKAFLGRHFVDLSLALGLSARLSILGK